VATTHENGRRGVAGLTAGLLSRLFLFDRACRFFLGLPFALERFGELEVWPLIPVRGLHLSGVVFQSTYETWDLLVGNRHASSRLSTLPDACRLAVKLEGMSWTILR